MSSISNFITPDNTVGTSQYLNQLGQQTLNQTGGATKTDATTLTTGTGQIAGVHTAPDPAGLTHLSAMMASIASIMPKLSDDEIQVLTESITQKMKDTIDKSQMDKVKNDQEKQHSALLAKEKKLQEAEKKINDAIDAQKHASIWDKIKLAFEYLGAILAMVAGVFALLSSAVTGPAGAVAGVLLITSGLMMLTLAIDDTVSQATAKDGQPGMGMFGLMCKAIAKSEGKTDAEAEEIGKKGEMGFKIGLMAIAIITGAVGMFLNPTAAVSDAEEIGVMTEETEQDMQDLGTTVQDGVDMSNSLQDTESSLTDVSDVEEASTSVSNASSGWRMQIAESIVERGQGIERGLKIADNLSNVGSATQQIGSSTLEYQASDDQAAAKTAQAEAKELQALGKFLDGMIDMAIQNLKHNGDRFNAILDSVTDAIKDRSDTMSQAKFRA